MGGGPARRPSKGTPSLARELLGVVEVERTRGSGETYTVIEYSAQVQELLLALYRDGNL